MQSLADLIYPELCVGCGRPTRGAICRACLESLDPIGPQVCDRCGFPTNAEVARCGACKPEDFAFDRARQSFAFDSTVRKAIHQLKYQAHRGLAESLAIPLAELVPSINGPATLTWVPSSTRRLRERGFDHARLIAEAVAGLTGARCGELIVKIRETPPQVQLQPKERRTALAGVFACRLPPPARVVVIDDVFTTGATASEAARALKEAGAADVTVLALARSLPPKHPVS